MAKPLRTLADIREAYPDLADMSDFALADLWGADNGLPSPAARFKLGLEQRNSGLMEDAGTNLKAGIQKLPGALGGLVELPITAVTGARPITRAMDAAGRLTGFTPGKWAEDAPYLESEGTVEARANVQKVWDDPKTGALDILGAYVRNPSVTGMNVVGSIPGIVAGGGLARGASLAARGLGLGVRETALAEGAMGPGRATTAPWVGRTALGAGEGGISAGYQMEQYDPDLPGQQRNALTSLGVGAGVGALGVAGSALATRAGLIDIDALMAGGKPVDLMGLAKRPLSTTGRIGGGMVSEGLFEEAGQSALEQAGQNYANDRPLGEGVPRATTEGSIAGGVIGGGTNVFSGRSRRDWQAAVTGAQKTLADESAPPEHRRVAADFLQKVQENDIPAAEASEWRRRTEQDLGNQEFVNDTEARRAAAAEPAPAPAPAAPVAGAPTPAAPVAADPAAVAAVQQQIAMKTAELDALPADMSARTVAAKTALEGEIGDLNSQLSQLQGAQDGNQSQGVQQGGVQGAQAQNQVPGAQAAAGVGGTAQAAPQGTPGEVDPSAGLDPAVVAARVTEGMSRVSTGPRPANAVVDGANPIKGDPAKVRFVAKAIFQPKDTPKDAPVGPYAKLHNALHAWNGALQRAITDSSKETQDRHFEELIAAAGGAEGSVDAVAPLLSALETEFGTDGVDAVIKQMKTWGARLDRNENAQQVRLAAAWNMYKNGELDGPVGTSSGSDNIARENWVRERFAEQIAKEMGIDTGSLLEDRTADKNDGPLRKDAENVGGRDITTWQGEKSGILRFLSDGIWQNFDSLQRNLSKALYSFYTAKPELLPKIKFSKDPSPDDAKLNTVTRAEYDPTSNVLTVYPAGHSVLTILHELLHAATVRYLQKNPNSPAAKYMESTLTAFGKLHTKDAYKAYLDKADPEGLNGLKARLDIMVKESVGAFAKATDKEGKVAAMSEFVAYGQTEPEFQAYMKSINLDANIGPVFQLTQRIEPGGQIKANTKLSVWSRFVNATAWIITGKPWNNEAKTMLDHFMSSSAGLLEEISQPNERDVHNQIVAAQAVREKARQAAGGKKGAAWNLANDALRKLRTELAEKTGLFELKKKNAREVKAAEAKAEPKKAAPKAPVKKEAKVAPKAPKKRIVAAKPAASKPGAEVAKAAFAVNDVVTAEGRTDTGVVVRADVGAKTVNVVFGGQVDRNGRPVGTVVPVPVGKLTKKLGKMKSQTPRFGTRTGELRMNKEETIQLLGANMYGSSLGEVTIKEALQNSFDAVKGYLHGNKETAPGGTGHLHITANAQKRTLKFEDDGIGMTPQIVDDAFFTIAGSDKSGMPPELRSGGLGMAKMGILMGAERIQLVTIRDGVRTSLDTTPKEISGGTFEIVTSPAAKGEHGTTLTLTIPEKFTNPRTGDESHISFPGSAKYVGALNKPLIGPIEVKYTEIGVYDDTPVTTVMPTGANFDKTPYQKMKTVQTDWGTLEVYFGIKRTDSPTHTVLSSGVYQFAHYFKIGTEQIPFDIIVDVKSKVKATDIDYPFENSRERFKPRVREDISALDSYLGAIARGEAAKDLKAGFKNIVSMPRTEVGADIAETSSKLRKAFDKRRGEEGKGAGELPRLPDEVVIKHGEVSDSAGTVVARTVAKEKEAEKTAKASFKADENVPTVAEFMASMKENPSQPIFHNNTSADYVEIGKKYGDPQLFFSELGTIMVEMKEALAGSKMYGYEGLDAKQLFFAGVSVDRKYGGVHIKVPFKAVLVNPFYDWGAKTLFGVRAGLYETMTHEIAHQGDMDHGVGHNAEMLKVRQYLADIGKEDYFRDALLDTLTRHESTFTAMREAYGQSTTENTGKSLDAFKENTAAASSGRGASGAPDPSRAVRAGGGQSGDGGIQTPAGRGDEGQNSSGAGDTGKLGSLKSQSPRVERQVQVYRDDGIGQLMVRLMVDHPKVRVDLEENPDGSISLALITTREKEDRGEGYGPAAMKDLVAVADMLGKDISLFAQPATAEPGERQMTLQELENWYRRFGFAAMPREEQPFPGQGTYMYREPKRSNRGEETGSGQDALADEAVGTDEQKRISAQRVGAQQSVSGQEAGDGRESQATGEGRTLTADEYKTALRYEDTLFGKPSPARADARAMVKDSRGKYNAIRQRMGLDPVTSWDKLPADTVAKRRPFGTMKSQAPAEQSNLAAFMDGSVATENGEPGGKPLVLVHTTGETFHTFGKKAHRPIWMTEQDHYRGGSGGTSLDMKLHAAIRAPLDFSPLTDKLPRTRGKIDYDLSGKGARDLDAFLRGKGLAAIADYIGLDEHNGILHDFVKDYTVVQMLKEAGYDGVKLEEDTGHKTWVAFDRNQVKSSTNNSGAYDRSNPNIMKSQTPAMNPAPVKNGEVDFTPYMPSENIVTNSLRAALPSMWANDPANRTAMTRMEKTAAAGWASVKKHWPWLAKVTAYFNPYVNIPLEYAESIGLFKRTKGSPLSAANAMFRFLKRADHAKILDMFHYMDDDTKVGSLTEHERYLANNTKRTIDRLLADATKWDTDDAKEKGTSVSARLEGLTYSDIMTVISKSEDTLSHGFGVKNIKGLAQGAGDHKSVGMSAIDTLPMSGGPHKGGKFYAVLTVDGGVQTMVHAAHVGRHKNVDMTKAYQFDNIDKDGAKQNGEETWSFRPIGNVESMLAADRTGEEVGGALLNTISIIANANAVKGMTAFMADNPGEHVFNDVEALRKHTGANTSPLDIGANAAKSGTIKTHYRNPGEWIHLPRSDSMGALSGKIISGPLWAAIDDATNRKPALDISLFNSSMSAFKIAMTVYNPVTVFSNFMSNWSLAHMNNIRYRTVGAAIRLFYLNARYPERPESEGGLKEDEREILADFQQSGATLGDWSTSEARQLLYESIINTSETAGKSYLSEAAEWAQSHSDRAVKAAEWAKKGGKTAAELHNMMTDIYAAGDNVFRLAAFMSKMGELRAEGHTNKDEMIDKAGAYAKDVFLDYDIDARALQWAKGTIIPFASFTYAAAKRYANIAKTQPWKLAEIAVAYQIASMALLAATGDSDDEDKRKRHRDNKDARTWFGSYQYVRLPSFGGTTNYLELARWLPTPFPAKGMPNGFMGFSMFPQSLTPNGPVLSIGAAAFGVNLYTGKGIHKETDSDTQKFGNFLAASGSSVSPAWLRKGVRLADDPTGPLGKTPDAAATAAGLLLAPVTTVNDAEAKYRMEQNIKHVDRVFKTEESRMKKKLKLGKIDMKEYKTVSEALKARHKEELREAKGID